MSSYAMKVCTGRRGKIARLPLAVREELNIRLRNGEEGAGLVLWLNGLPEVGQILAARFKGKPIAENNLTHWKKGGYKEWFLRQMEADTPVTSVLEMAPALVAQVQDGYTDKMALLLSSHMLAELKRHRLSADTEAEATLWRHLSVILVHLKRYEHVALKTHREEAKEQAKKPKRLTEDQKRRELSRILGLDPDRPRLNPKTDLFEGPGADALNEQRERLKKQFGGELARRAEAYKARREVEATQRNST